MKLKLIIIAFCLPILLLFSCSLFKPAPRPPDRYTLHYHSFLSTGEWKVESYYSADQKTKIDLSLHDYRLHVDSASRSVSIMKGSRILLKGNTIIGLDTLMDKRMFLFPMALGLYHYLNDGTKGVLNGDYWKYNLDSSQENRDTTCGAIMTILNYSNIVSWQESFGKLLLTGNSWAGDSLLISQVIR